MEYGLIGARLGHSYSPVIHRQLGDYRYELLALPEEAQARAFLEEKNFRGINVTIPYKQLVIPYCDWVDPAAREIGAVNTVVNRGGRLYGWNTDLAGFEYLLAAHGVSLAGKTVLILGTGGTCKTVTAAAKRQGAAAILTASRRGGAECLAYEEASRRPDVQVVVNTSPAGMYPNVGQCLLTFDGLTGCEAVFDVVYNPFKTELLLRAEEAGIPAWCGFEMLVGQAVYAARHFLDTEFEPGRIAQIHSSLKAELSNLSLVGMPGSGKTGIGKKLARLLGKTFVDLDEEIAREAGLTIPEIFAREGEAGFRQREARAVARFSAENHQLLSCGGGVVTTPGNVRQLRQNGPVLFIDRPLEQLATEGRPLSTDAGALRQMEARRRPLYEAAADAVVPNRGTFEEAVEAAMEAYHATFDHQRA